MAYELPLPHNLAVQGWKVKIADKEIAEEPHATVIRRVKRWRYSLRSRSFLDDVPPPGEVPKALLKAIDVALAELVAQWDRMYPHNPVRSE